MTQTLNDVGGRTQRLGVFRLHVLGAESTGKSSLMQALAARFTSLGVPNRCVDEHLRAWVQQNQRPPTATEQWNVAQQQERAITLACLEMAQSPAPYAVVIADTSPWMTAAYSAHYHGDDSLWQRTLGFESTADLRLLMGLDLPWQADPGQRDGRQHQHAVDAVLRHSLQTHGLPYAVVYGQQQARTDSAWRAVHAAIAAKQQRGHRQHIQTRQTWRAVCECCADPASELALFTQRQMQRPGDP